MFVSLSGMVKQSAILLSPSLFNPTALPKVTFVHKEYNWHVSRVTNFLILFHQPASGISEGEDFLLDNMGVITITANQSRGCLAVTILQSAVIEGEEKLLLTITPIVNAVVVAAETSIIIAQDGSKILQQLNALELLIVVKYKSFHLQSNLVNMNSMGPLKKVHIKRNFTLTVARCIGVIIPGVVRIKRCFALNVFVLTRFHCTLI